MKQIILLNGKFVHGKDACLPVLSYGLLYGAGVFETMRAYKKKIVYLEAHFQRLAQGCALLGIPLKVTFKRIKQDILRALEVTGLPDAYVRLTLWKNANASDMMILVKPYVAYSSHVYARGLRAGISRFTQQENSFYAQLKSTSYALYYSAYQEARKLGFEEALILNSRGYVCEASRSNIFLVKDTVLFTPSLGCGCLKGITREAVFALARKQAFKICEDNITVPDFYRADEAFLTNSLMGIMPLASIEGKKIGKGVSRFQILPLLRARYNALLT